MVLTLWGLFFVTTFPQSKGSLSKKGTFSCPGDFASSPPIPKSSMFLAQLISDIQSFQILGRGGGFLWPKWVLREYSLGTTGIDHVETVAAAVSYTYKLDEKDKTNGIITGERGQGSGVPPGLQAEPYTYSY